jgi:hypothetical protein
MLQYPQNSTILLSKSYLNIPYFGTEKLIIRICMKTIFTLLLIAVSFTAFSQQVIRQKSCSSVTIAQQVDSMKQSFEKNGFVVLKEASMSMESEFEMPVIVPLTQGAWYHIVFIGEPSSKLHEVRMYDYDEKQVYFKKLYGYSEGNIISYGYMPKISEWHMIKPVQVNKGQKNCCGYIMLLKKVKGDTDVIPSR